jgi:hypothetical protein
MLPLNLGPYTWDSNCGIWVEPIYVYRPVWFSQMTVDGTGYRDIGAPQPVHKDLYGIFSILPDGFGGMIQEEPQTL